MTANRAIRVIRSAWYIGPISLARRIGSSSASSETMSIVPSMEPLSITIASSITEAKWCRRLVSMMSASLRRM